MRAWRKQGAVAMPAIRSRAQPTTAQPTTGVQPIGSAGAFTPEQLEQVAAPVALYPDPLLSQVQQGQAGNRSQRNHNPEHRQGVQYRDQGTQQRYNKV